MRTLTRRGFVGGVALLPSLRFSTAQAQAGVSPAEARAIAKEAYIYGFPIVDNYRIQHTYWVDRSKKATAASMGSPSWISLQPTQSSTASKDASRCG